MRAIIATAWSPEGLSIMTSRSLYSARSAVSGEKREMMNLYNSKILIIDDNRELGGNGDANSEAERLSDRSLGWFLHSGNDCF